MSRIHNEYACGLNGGNSYVGVVSCLLLVIGDKYLEVGLLIFVCGIVEVDVEAAFAVFNVHINSLGEIVGHITVVLRNSTVEVIRKIAETGLIVEELICGSFNKGSYLRGNNGGLSGNSDLEYCLERLAVELKGCGKLYGSCRIGKSYGKLSISYDCTSIVTLPGDLNVTIGDTGSGKIDNGVGLDFGRNLEVILFESKLFVVVTLGHLEVRVSVNTYGNEIECVLVNGDDTCCICKRALVCSVRILEGLLIISVDEAGRAGNSYVGFLACKLEVVVAAGLLLTGDLNALDGYEHTLLCNECLIGKLLCIGVDLGEVNGSNSLFGSIKNLYNSALDLVSTTVNNLFTGNSYGVTDLDVKVSHRVLAVCDLIYVVSALALSVLNVNCVDGALLGLGGYTGNETFDNYVAGFLCVVLCCGVNCKLGNYEGEFSGNLVVLCISDGSSKLISNLCITELGNNDVYKVGIFVSSNLDSLVVTCPGNGISNAVYGYYTNESVSCGGFLCLILVKVKDNAACGFERIFLVFVFIGELDAEPAANGLLNGINDTESRILNTAKLSGDFFNRASGKAGKHEYHNEN